MAGNCMSPPERQMRQTIEWLLSLPADEQDKMAEAVPYWFSRDEPAPACAGFAAARARGSVRVTLNAGCVEAAELLCRPGLRLALLNFAHGYNCGGGFEHAGGSQEEAIFRASSVFLSLWPHRRADDGPGVLARGMWIGDFDEVLPRREPFYPHSDCGGVYSPHVRLVRRTGVPSSPLVPAEEVLTAPLVAVITAAAQNVNWDPPFDDALLHQKVRSVLHMAAANEHNALVLGAFGCGYFRNPPSVVAAKFEELLDGEFAGAFPVVVFAVPDRHGRNLDEFARRFRAVPAKELDAALASTAAAALAEDGPPAGAPEGRRLVSV